MVALITFGKQRLHSMANRTFPCRPIVAGTSSMTGSDNCLESIRDIVQLAISASKPDTETSP